MVIANLDSMYVTCRSIWQYDYGMVLRLQGAKLPTATEIHFSFEEHSGEAKPRIGLTKDGITDVVIPDTFVENDFTSQDYKIYVFIYLTDENSCRTEYKITIPVKSRPRLEAFDKPEDTELFREAINEVNKSATSAQESATKSATAKDESIAASKEAKQSAEAASVSAQASKNSADASKESEKTASSAATEAVNAKDIAVKAANSAYNSALASSRSAKEAQTNAEQADTAAKSANESKQAIVQLEQAIDSTAEQIATDRTAVEADKKEVQEAKSSVEDLKEAIEQKSSEALVDLENTEVVIKKNIIDLKDVVIKKGNEAISGIETARDNAINDVNNAKDTAVNTIAQEEESAVNAVDDAKDNAVAEINKNENVQQIKQNKDDIEEAKTDIEELKDKKITKFYANSIGESYLQDSDDGKIQDMILYGKSEQKQYTGKNLLKYPYDNTTKTANGIIFTDNGDGSVTIKGTATTNSYFSFHDNADGRRLNLPTGTYKLIIKGIDKVKGLLISNSCSAENDRIFTVTDGNNEVWCFIEVPKDIAINETIYPMIQSTTYQNEDYEPYVGEIPSPNTEYPQEIRSVVNPVVKIHGKNLLYVKMINCTINGIEFVPRADGTLAINGTATANTTYTIKKDYALKAGTYSIKGCKAYYRTENGKSGWFGTDNNTFAVATFDSDVKLNILVYIPTGTTMSAILKPMLAKGNIEREYEQYKEQIVNLPYTLNAIPVKNGGNITIDGQQYIADYVDVERGKLVRNVREVDFSTCIKEKDYYNILDNSKEIRYSYNNLKIKQQPKGAIYNNGGGFINAFTLITSTVWNKDQIGISSHAQGSNNMLSIRIPVDREANEYFDKIGGCKGLFEIDTPEEIDLTQEEIEAFKELATYYPVTNISVTSDQLDGCTTFNYPVSMKNGWDYVKQQLNDNRDYIYDMDAKTQDIDTQSAEAYVNSEYAVALTELEVM